MSGDVVARAKDALEGVTEGPWKLDDHEDTDYDTTTVGTGTYLDSPGHYTSTDLIHEVDTYGIELDSKDYAQITADAKFIAAARSLIPELVAEVEKWRDVAERLDAYTPDELDTEVSSLGDYMIVDGQCWGRYAIEGILDALDAKDQVATDLIERIEDWKRLELTARAVSLPIETPTEEKQK